jgi:hypothetical protein
MDIDDYDWDWAAMEDFSAAVLGSRHRLAVLTLAATSEPESLYVQAIADRLRVREELSPKELENFTRRQLNGLERAHLLAANPAPPARPAGKTGRPPRYLTRTEHEFWSCLQDLGARFRRAPRR